jgi:anti-sigma factor RsiW
MTCEETRSLLDGYIDGELDLVRSMEVERHAKGCDSCRTELRGLSALHQSIGSSDMRYSAPKELLSRINKSLKKEGAKRSVSGKSRLWIPLAYTVAAAVIVIVAVGMWRSSTEQNRIADQVVASHVRSLMADHLFDVQSTDQHTVKPWFHGKLDYAPPVQDFARQGYPLVGGRLDYIAGRPVAAVVFQKRQHPINLFVWPLKDSSNSRPRNLMRSGYNIVEWNKDGMEHWLISDLSDNELRAFAQMLQEQ